MHLLTNHQSLLPAIEGTNGLPGLLRRGCRALLLCLAAASALLATPFVSAQSLAPGTVAAWGYNAFGQTIIPTDLTDIKAMAGGSYHSLALKTDGTVVAWGANDDGQIDVPTGLTNIKAILISHQIQPTIL